MLERQSQLAQMTDATLVCVCARSCRPWSKGVGFPHKCRAQKYPAPVVGTVPTNVPTMYPWQGKMGKNGGKWGGNGEKMGENGGN